MLDLKNDPKCKEIDEMLLDYATKYVRAESMKKLAKSDDIAFRDSVISFNEEKVACENFYTNLINYLDSIENIDDKKQAAGHFLFKTVELCKYNKKTKRQSPFLNGGAEIFSCIIENYPLSKIDKSKFYAFIKGAKQKKISTYAFHVVSPKDYENPLSGKNLDEIVPGGPLLRDYTGYLCKYASDCYMEDVKTDTLLDLLKRNASAKGLDIKQASLFEPAYKKDAIDKKVVLEVAKVFASYINKDANIFNENNGKFEYNMCKMFAHIASRYGYKKKDIEELNNVIMANSSDKKCGENLVKKINFLCCNIHRQMSKDR